MLTRVGLVINPIAGMGGSVGLKGTDGVERLAEARARGATPAAQERAAEFLRELRALVSVLDVQWVTGSGELGEDVLRACGCDCAVVHTAASGATSPQDTEQLLYALLVSGVDLLVFVGGDGTARDVLNVMQDRLPVLGVPAGVKMHSGVFAISPRAAARVVGELLSGQIVSSVLRQVRDFADKASASEGIALRAYGELRVPEAGMWLQQTKVGGKESEPLAVEEIIADLQAQSLFDRPLVIGAGSTCLAFKNALIEGGTLRGVDVRTPDGAWQFDVAEKDLLALSHARLVVGFARQQGFLFGRGNQVLSSRFLRRLTWPDDVLIIGTRNKLLSLEGRPLLVDTGDRALDAALCGLVEIVSGFEDRLLYRVAIDYAGGANP